MATGVFNGGKVREKEKKKTRVLEQILTVQIYLQTSMLLSIRAAVCDFLQGSGSSLVHLEQIYSLYD